MPLPVRRTEFRPQKFTPNFVLPVTHEMYIQPYLKYCLESNSYTFEKIRQDYRPTYGVWFSKHEDSFQLLLLNVSSSTVAIYHDTTALQFPASIKGESNQSVPRSGIHKYKFEPLYAPMPSSAISKTFIAIYRSSE